MSRSNFRENKINESVESLLNVTSLAKYSRLRMNFVSMIVLEILAPEKVEYAILYDYLHIYSGEGEWREWKKTNWLDRTCERTGNGSKKLCQVNLQMY